MTANSTAHIGHPSFGRRLLTSATIALVAMLATAMPAMAKVPYFSIELEGGPPAPGESLGIIVRMYEDPGHTKPADWLGASVADLIAVAPVDGATGESMDVLLKETAPGVYRGSVVIPSAGTWIVRPFPDADVGGEMPRMEGFPGDMTVEVAEPGPPLPLIAGTALALATLAGLSLIVARRGLRRLDPQTGAAG